MSFILTEVLSLLTDAVGPKGPEFRKSEIPYRLQYRYVVDPTKIIQSTYNS